MKKVGIVTLHFSINYGAVLQCAALVRTIKKLGNEVEVIDYVPPYLKLFWQDWKSPIYECKIQKKYCGRNIIKTAWKMSKIFGKTMWENRHYFERKKKSDKFKQFNKEYLSLSNTQYNTLEQLNRMESKYDCLVSGSDQVWNPNFTKNKFDEVYFLKFGKKEQKRIAYAASTGILGSDEFYIQLKDMIAEFNAVSVREKSLASALSNVGAGNVISVIDPTLFLTGDEWEKYEKDVRTNRKFLLVYCLTQHEEFQEILNEIHKVVDLEIIDISPQNLNVSYSCKHDKVCGPGEFLWYIHHAEYIVTNSFHGTVFSILYQKQFITVADDKTGSRMKDLLCELALDERLYNKDRCITSYMGKIDYSEPYKILDNLRVSAEQFLNNNIGD